VSSGLRLRGRRSAFNVQKVAWLLEELGLAHEHREAGGSFGGLDTPEFRALNPHGRVPVLEDGPTVVWESHSILRYLAARYASPQLWSPDPALRSHVDRWMDWSQTSLQPLFMDVFWGYFRTPPELRNAAAIERSRRACETSFSVLAAWLETRSFVAGDEFSLADIPAGTTLFRWFEMGLEVARPAAIERWYGRLAERPAYRRTVMMPFDELRGRTSF
jgi:glutathione S-transferase